MTMGMIIAEQRSILGITQSALAEKLDVTNQAVSKWETDQCYPDVTLLPKLADIFHISIDALFGRTAAFLPEENTLPWGDDDAFHVVLFHGHKLMGAQPAENPFFFRYDGPAKDVFCSVNLECGPVAGNITAECSVECAEVGGNVTAGGYVECADVGRNITAGGYVECGNVGMNVSAGAYVECNNVGGDVKAGTYVECTSENHSFDPFSAAADAGHNT